MKVAVYTICKDEAHHVDRFMSCLKEADGVFVTDTGSSDDTVDRLKRAGAIVNRIHVNPWRFDIARNASLDFVPFYFNVCLSIDLDEVLTPGWCNAIKNSFHEDVDRLRYKYVWSHLPDGSPGTTFWYDKCHRRRGFRWVKPVHEVLQFYQGQERQAYCDQFELHHYPDMTKSRSSYLSLLELGCKEEPNDDRNCHYLGREYLYHQRYDDAIRELKRHLSLSTATWDAERSASMKYIAKCYQLLGDFSQAIRWLLRATAEAPGEREPWVDLGNTYQSLGDHAGAYYAFKQALKIKDRPMSYICEPDAWGPNVELNASISARELGLLDDALSLVISAIEKAPTDAVLRQNLQLIANEIRSKL